MNTLTLLNIEFAAATHLMMSLVLFFFARRSVQFLSQAWIMLIICLLYCGGLSFFACGGEVPSLGILHPVMLIYLMICSFLLSVYPLGLCMPGYLQWGRMWGYAIPALLVISIYGMGAAVGSNLAKVYELDDFLQYFLSGDILLRIVALSLSGYYIVNIFRLPHRLVRRMQLPRDLIAYGSALGAVSIFFVVIAVNFSLVLLNIYVILFTLVNLFLFFRILRPSVEGMAYPAIHEVEKMPTQEEITQTEIDDFNEANLKRFKMMEYIMLHEKPFIDTMFNRERLCRLVGYNRHVVLQTLRSQGYNDIHEYISRHRVAELRRLVESGEVTELKETDKVGFKTSKTAVVCFERYEGEDLNALLEEHAAARPEEAPEGKVEDGEAGE